MNKVLVIAPHPDDETLGCGGTILKHVSNGDEVSWLIVTNIFEEYGWKKEICHNRQNEIEKVSNAYQFKRTFKLDYPTMLLDTFPVLDIIKAISKVIDDYRPDTIYLPNRSDVHSDHRIVFQAAYSCTKSFRYPFIKKIFMYETLSETEFSPSLPENTFNPNVFIEISDFIEKKLEIISIYKSEVMEYPNPRSFELIRILSKLRGSRIGIEYAESFMLIFERR
jgi:LmbE family N-acetylglucosaminyl deacetylase